LLGSMGVNFTFRRVKVLKKRMPVAEAFIGCPL